MGLAQRALGRLLGKLGAALYHSPYFARPWRAPCPSIVTLHDVIPLQMPESMGPFRRSVYRRIVADALRAERVITDSCFSRDSIRAAFPKRDPQLLVVYAGARPWESGEPWPAWERPAVLTLGINKPHKNLETLVRALAMFPEGSRPLLVSAGPVDPRYPDLATLAEQHGVAGDARAVGMVPEAKLASLYRSATIFAFPSRMEGFGLPLLEAMALGVPTIASDIPVLREIGGDAARFVPADDAGAWSAAAAALIADPAERASLARAGLERAKAFDYASSASALAREYEALVPELSPATAAAASGVRP